MKRLLFLFTLLAATASAQSVAERLDALFTTVDGAPYLHGGVLVAENGRVVYHRAFGHADVAAQTPNTADSRFQIASMSKIFTSTAVMQLVEKKRLQLDDPVVRHLRDFPFANITIRQLLAHTSGLPDLELYEAMVAREPSRIIRNADVIPALREWQKGPAFAPGTAFRYSNTNFVMLALIIEKVSGMPYPRHLERFVLTPAGMRDTYVLTDVDSPDAKRVKNHILPAMYDTTPRDVRTVNLKDAVKMRRIRYETRNLGATLGDQNIISTTLDLFRFQQALQRGKLLRPSTWKEATTPALVGGTIRYDEPGPPFAKRCSYGLGWEVCEDMLGHSGYNRGISSLFYFNPARQQFIVMFDNADGEDFGSKVASVVNVLNGKPPLDVDRRKSLTREYGRTLLDKGAAAALIAFNRMRADTARFVGGSQRGLNILGYDLLHNGYVAESLEPFRINVILHPNDPKVYESYNEALAAYQSGTTGSQPVNPAIDAVFADVDPKAPGYAVGVVQKGQLVYARGYGLANLDDATPITRKSVFNIASLSKQFTAAAIAILIRDGKLSLEQPVPEVEGVRIKHLLYMTSGIPEYYRQSRPGGKTWERDPFTIEDAIAASLAQPLEFEPGTRWSYSNVNYMLLAKIVERVSGEPFSSFLRRRIFEPLGMSSTHVNDDLTRVVPHRAIGYNVRENGGFHRHDRISPHYGGSGVFSTIEDLAKWEANFSTHTLGGPELTALQLSTMKFAHEKTNDAFGRVWGEYKGFRTLWYEGGDLGFSSYVVRFPDQDLSIIVLSNLGSGRAADRARKVADVLLPGGTPLR
ncbi:MAG TPA: serine hydrolase domain-containing protein [Thermoanaerobaculia bacterium]|nr:serine hydrolase domain-containing protein [Thermoanaerobaculia bacterium]